MCLLKNVLRTLQRKLPNICLKLLVNAIEMKKRRQQNIFTGIGFKNYNRTLIRCCGNIGKCISR